MPFVNVTLDLDIDTYEKVKAGTYELLGMVKDHNHRVKKHLPTVVDSAKEGTAKAIDIVRNHKKELLIVGGIVIVGGAIIGTVSHFTQKEKQKAKQHLGESFQAYIDAAQNGSLTVEIVDTLITDLDLVSKLYKDDVIPFNLSAKQLSVLFNSIYDYTKRMAEANKINPPTISAPKLFKKSTITDLQNYLHIQKKILCGAA